MQQKTRKPAKVCNGHIWMPTSSLLFDRCGRAGCNAMRQYVNGAWVEPTTDQPKPVTPIAEQAQLWA